MKEYLTALEYILENGKDRDDRTGVGTRGVFGYQMRFNLRDEFPAVTTKRLAWKSVVSELLWFLEGSTDERRLAEIHYGDVRENLIGKSTIWTANADKQGKALGYVNDDMAKNLGPVYGSQWRSWNARGHHVDQIIEVMKSIYNDPTSRRHIVSAWNAGEIDKMALPPCHTMFQFYVQDGELSCQLYQRSADMFLGVPFNIASYSLLTHIMAKMLGLKVGDFVWTGGDCHIYQNHFDQVKEQINRVPVKGPKLLMPEFGTLFEILEADPTMFVLKDYNPMDSIKAPMAV
tara:strand:+ start:1493 stop:2359 length:867 start_codon:yes stop_codon:yes gene_type:complete